MTDTFKRLAQAFVPSAAGLLYQVPAGTQGIVRHIRLVNTDGVARTVTLYNGGTAGVNTILGPVTLQPGETLTDDCFVSMATGDTIQGASPPGGVVACSIYGMEIS